MDRDSVLGCIVEVYRNQIQNFSKIVKTECANIILNILKRNTVIIYTDYLLLNQHYCNINEFQRENIFCYEKFLSGLIQLTWQVADELERDVVITISKQIRQIAEVNY